MTITPSINSIIDCLEKTNDPSVAYFSFTVDDSGESGAIRANKEGLRRYALELLKKSVEMEERRDGRNLCFASHEWLISDAGYDLIRSVKPEYVSRTEILSRALRESIAPFNMPATRKRGRLGLWLLIISLLAVAAAIIAFY
jgi:hypothetical protein